jgi:hypothetical protein
MFLLFSCVCLYGQGKPADKRVVKGVILLQTMTCLDQPLPPDEMQKAMAPRPYAGKTLYVRKGILNDLKSAVILKFTADKQGRFSFSLPPGVYSIVQEEQLKAFNMKNYKLKAPLTADESCLKDWWQKPFKVIEVGEVNIDSVELKFVRRCKVNSDNPCFHNFGTP